MAQADSRPAAPNQPPPETSAPAAPGLSSQAPSPPAARGELPPGGAAATEAAQPPAPTGQASASSRHEHQPAAGLGAQVGQRRTPLDDERAASSDAEMDPAAFEEIGEWIEEVLRDAGRGGDLLRAYVARFPPTSAWEISTSDESSELAARFAPSAPSYAAAVRQIAAGRRRVEIRGRWTSVAAGALVIAARIRVGGSALWEIVEAGGAPRVDR